MPRLLVFAVLAVSIACNSPASKQDAEGELYFPVVVGAKKVWEMNDSGSKTKFTETVTKVEVKDGVYTVTTASEVFNNVESSVFEVSEKGVFRMTTAGQQTKEPIRLLKLGGKAGDTWTSEFELTAAKEPQMIKHNYTLGQEEVVEVPAGKFKALRVDVEIEQRGATEKITFWYAKGVGRVKSEKDRGNRIDVTELVSFTPGKGEKKDR